MSPAHKDHSDPTKSQLGVIVCHKPGVHGCKYGINLSTQEEQQNLLLHQDERCYFCQVVTM